MYQLENHFNHCAAEWTLPVPEAWETAFLRADRADLSSPSEHLRLGDWEFEAVTGDVSIDLSDLVLASAPAKVAFISADIDGHDPLLDVLRADGVEIIRITAGRDGEQISNYLFTHDHIDSIHIIAGQPNGCRVEQRDATALAAALIAPECGFSYSAIVEFSESHFSQIFSVAALPLTVPSSVVLEDGAVILFDEHANAVHRLSFTIHCLSTGDAVEPATTVKYRYFNPDESVNQRNINLLAGHAGLGNDGHCTDAQFLHTNAIDGKISLDGVSFCKSEIRRRGRVFTTEDTESTERGEGIFSHEGTENTEGGEGEGLVAVGGKEGIIFSHEATKAQGWKIRNPKHEIRNKFKN